MRTSDDSRAARADEHQAEEGRSRLLLEFMGALERGLFTAHSGSSLRARVPDEAAAFFVQNRKVRSSSSSPTADTEASSLLQRRPVYQQSLLSSLASQHRVIIGCHSPDRACSRVASLQVVDEWFVRIRGLLMRTSAAAGAAQLTLANGHARLTALAGQLRQLQRAAAPAPPALAGDPAARTLGLDSNEVPVASSHNRACCGCQRRSLQHQTASVCAAQDKKETAQPAPEAPVVLLQRPKPAQLQVWQRTALRLLGHTPNCCAALLQPVQTLTSSSLLLGQLGPATPVLGGPNRDPGTAILCCQRWCAPHDVTCLSSPNLSFVVSTAFSFVLAAALSHLFVECCRFDGVQV